MRKLSLLACVLMLGVLFGCSSESKDDAGEVKTTAAINNNAPEAKTAPGAAAPDTGMPPPGMAMKKKGGGAPTGIAGPGQPAPGAPGAPEGGK